MIIYNAVPLPQLPPKTTPPTSGALLYLVDENTDYRIRYDYLQKLLISGIVIETTGLAKGGINDETGTGTINVPASTREQAEDQTSNEVALTPWSGAIEINKMRPKATKEMVDEGTDDVAFITSFLLDYYINSLELTVEDASETVKGIAMIANSGDITSGNDDSKMLTIKKMLMRTATLSRAGVVTLSESTSGSSNLKAATEKAVGIAKSTADDAQTTANSAQEAANRAQQTADSKWTAQDATTTQKGILMLSHETDGDDQTKAASEYALGQLNEKVVSKLRWVEVASGQFDDSYPVVNQGKTKRGTIQVELPKSQTDETYKRFRTGVFRIDIERTGAFEFEDASSAYHGASAENIRESQRLNETVYLEFDLYTWASGVKDTGIHSAVFSHYYIYELQNDG